MARKFSRLFGEVGQKQARVGNGQKKMPGALIPPLNSLYEKNLSSPVSGSTVVTAVTLAIGGNRSKIAYFSHSAGTARAQRTVRPRRRSQGMMGGIDREACEVCQ